MNLTKNWQNCRHNFSSCNKLFYHSCNLDIVLNLMNTYWFFDLVFFHLFRSSKVSITRKSIAKVTTSRSRAPQIKVRRRSKLRRIIINTVTFNDRRLFDRASSFRTASTTTRKKSWRPFAEIGYPGDFPEMSSY